MNVTKVLPATIDNHNKRHYNILYKRIKRIKRIKRRKNMFFLTRKTDPKGLEMKGFSFADSSS